MTHTQRLISLISLLVLAATGTGCWLVERGSQPSNKDALKDVIPYTILDDDMTTIIKIGVDPSVNEQQLRATLVKAANDHQDDRARDYLTLMFLKVDAYLARNGDRSAIPAGSIRRYVPPGSPADRSKIKTDRTRDDKFTITLDEAKKSLR